MQLEDRIRFMISLATPTQLSNVAGRLRGKVDRNILNALFANPRASMWILTETMRQALHNELAEEIQRGKEKAAKEPPIRVPKMLDVTPRDPAAEEETSRVWVWNASTKRFVQTSISGLHAGDIIAYVEDPCFDYEDIYVLIARPVETDGGWRVDATKLSPLTLRLPGRAVLSSEIQELASGLKAFLARDTDVLAPDS